MDRPPHNLCPADETTRPNGVEPDVGQPQNRPAYPVRPLKASKMPDLGLEVCPIWHSPEALPTGPNGIWRAPPACLRCVPAARSHTLQLQCRTSLNHSPDDHCRPGPWFPRSPAKTWELEFGASVPQRSMDLRLPTNRSKTESVSVTACRRHGRAKTRQWPGPKLSTKSRTRPLLRHSRFPLSATGTHKVKDDCFPNRLRPLLVFQYGYPSHIPYYSGYSGRPPVTGRSGDRTPVLTHQQRVTLRVCLATLDPHLLATDDLTESRPHESPLTDCLHARLCEERFTTLEARMVDLYDYCKRPQCQCRRGTWYRTKSFLGSIKQRALSMKSRRKSQNTPSETGEEQGPERPSEGHPTSSAKELPDSPPRVPPAELWPSHSFIPELANSSWLPSPPRKNAYPALSTPQPRCFWHEYAGYRAAAETVLSLQGPGHLQSGVPHISELPAQSPTDILHSGSPYANTPSTPFPGVSSASQPSASTQGSYFANTPQLSISSASTDPFTAPEPGKYGTPLFATDTSDSPVGYGQADDKARWPTQPTTAQGNGWDSPAPLAELPASVPESPSRLGHVTPPLSPYSAASQRQPASRAASMDSLDNGPSSQRLPERIPSSVSRLPITGPHDPINLNRLRRTFAVMRLNPAWKGVSVESLSEYNDNHALLASLDEHENIRQGRIRDPVLPKLLFAYLAMSMSVEIQNTLPRPAHAFLQEEMTRFITSDGAYGLPECLLDVSTRFLYGKSSHPPDLNWPR